jgi:uncharacterized protein YbaP (TraB family)
MNLELVVKSIKSVVLILCFFVHGHAIAVDGQPVNEQPAGDKAFFWRVSSQQRSSLQDSNAENTTPVASTEGTTVYLMGSIHFADRSFYPLRTEIEEAFQRSHSLVVELDVNNIDNRAYIQIVSRRGVYENGATIKDKISADTWLQLQQRLKQLNIEYDSVKNYRPGILVLTLSATQVVQMGFDPALGIDAHFLTQARQGHSTQSHPKQVAAKQIIELETLQQQLDLFLDMPDGDLLLKETLYSLDESEQLMTDIVRIWKQGDEKQMNKLLFEDAITDYPAFTNIYDRLFYDRNKKMAGKIEKMLRSDKGSYFVVVGSGHLIGEKGIVSLLKNKGYNVERL